MAPSFPKWLQGALFTPLLVHAQSSTPAPGASATTSYRPIFTVPNEATLGATLLPNIVDPEAKNAQAVCPGYTASNVKTSDTSITADLALAGSPCNVYGTDVDALSLLVEYQTDQRLHVSIIPTTITPANESWYILSTVFVPDAKQEGGSASTSDLKFTWSNTPSFSFEVTREKTGDVLFSTTGTKLVYENQFIEFVTAESENYNVYGLGETIHGLRLGNNFTKTIYAADVGDPIDMNLYGSHPFYLDTRYFDESGALLTSNESSPDTTYTSYSHGVYLRNAHGQEILLQDKNITWRTIGGSIDLYFFSGTSQPEVTSQYLSMIGLPTMQQYFGFGFHQCRWGYENWTVVENVVNNYEKFGIPLECIWTDIDYMNQYRDFDNDPIRFGYEEGTAFLNRLHASGRHYIPIIDSAIYVPDYLNSSDAYPPFNDGNDTGSYMLNPDGSLYIGDVWPGYTVFPDWHTSAAKAWWSNQMVTWHGKIAYDGAWIDMSEVSSFCVGSCGSGNVTMNPVHPPFSLGGERNNLILTYPEGFNLTNASQAASASAAASSQSAAAAASSGTVSSTSTTYLRTTPTAGVRNVNHPPYVINHVQGDLAVHAVSPNATHHDGIQEYDVHNLFGHQIIQATYSGLSAVSPGTRPFIIGRSTFPGSGSYAGHWGGDNTSLWYYMFFSIPQALSFSLFGIPMFGVDTCGFNGNSDEELCNRWMQLSAFFPFYRNHNTLSANSQEAYIWASVIDATKTAMAIRFQLLPYIYTLFYHAHTQGSTVMRAMAWNFPNDPSLAAADRQFFLGDAILVTPVLDQGATSVNGVFPGLLQGTDVYYDWYTQAPVPKPATANTTIAAPLGHIPVYVRGGNVLALQQPAMTTRDARSTPWSLLVALGVDGAASGSVYLDDGVSVVPNATKVITFAASGGSIKASVEGSHDDGNALSNITILGVASAPSSADVTLNGKSVGQGTYDASAKTFTIANLDGATKSGAWAASWSLSWGGGSSSGQPVSQISDGQPQAPTAVSQISDGQPQAPTAATAVSEKSDGQPQATATKEG